MKEINDFASVLEIAIPERDMAVVSLAVSTVGAELRELAEHFPDHKSITVAGGQKERRAARMTLKDLALCLRRIELATSMGRFDEAAKEYQDFKDVAFSAVPKVLKRAEPWSLFNAGVHAAHYGALRRMQSTDPEPSP
jgi:hypothetical protein